MDNEKDAAVELKELLAKIDRKTAHYKAERNLLADSLFNARRKIGWSQAELARQAKLPQPLISRIENGKANPGLNTILKITKALGVNLVLE